VSTSSFHEGHLGGSKVAIGKEQMSNDRVCPTRTGRYQGVERKGEGPPRQSNASNAESIGDFCSFPQQVLFLLFGLLFASLLQQALLASDIGDEGQQEAETTLTGCFPLFVNASVIG